MSREQAYEWVQRNAMRSFDEQRPFKQLLLADPDVRRVLSADEIDRAFDLGRAPAPRRRDFRARVRPREALGARRRVGARGASAKAMGVGWRGRRRQPEVSAAMFDKLHEECGVFGIFGHPEASKMAYLGLYALQHRGQESAGIATSDGQRLVAFTGHGPRRRRVQRGRACRASPGRLAVGHVRYSTAGASKLVNAQPILIDCQHGQIALCHNGNLVNAAELRDELVRDGAIFQTSSDSEVILHLYARSKAPRVGGRRRRVARAGAGRVLARARDGGPADRGPRSARLPAAGARPAGRRRRSCASETCAMDLIGAT